MSTTLDLGRDSFKARRGAQGNDDGVVQRIAERIRGICLGDVDRVPATGVVSLPSERQLSKRLAVTRHAVRNALGHLEEHGDVQRVAGHAALIVSQGSPEGAGAVAPGTRCINFVQGPALSDPSLHGLLQTYLAGYTEVLDGYDFKTRFLFWEDDREDFAQMLWQRVPWTQQACILVNRASPALLGWLNDNHVPYVVQFYRPYDAHGLPPHHKVYVNKTGGAFKGTTHLLNLGHERVGYIGPTPDAQRQDAFVPPAYSGYTAAVQCAGLVPLPDDVLPLKAEQPELAVDACRKYLDRDDRPTAVLVSNGAMMHATRTAAEALGLRVPGDLSIVGLASVQDPLARGFTLVDLPQRLLAHASVEMLTDVVRQGGAAPRTRILECELHEGHTTGKPNQPA